VSPRRRTVVAGLALASSLALIGDQMLYVFLPGQPGAAGITAAALGIILSANRFVRLAANSLGGLLSDRIGRRRPYLLGMALALVSTTGYLVAPGFWTLLLCRVIWGIAFSLTSVGGVSIVLDLTSAQDRGATVGAYRSLVQCGTLLGLLLSGVLTDLLGYRATLAVYVPLTAIGCLVALLTLRHLAPRAPDAVMASRRGGTPAMLGSLDRRLLAPAAVNFASHFAGSGILMATLGVHVRTEMTASAGAGGFVPVASLTGMLLATRRLCGMIEAPLVGRLSDRLGRRRPVAAAGALASLAGFIVLAYGRGPASVIAGVVLVSIGEGALATALAAWAGDIAPAESRGVVMGGMATAADLGAALGPLVGYAMAGAIGLRWAYALGAAVILCTLPVFATRQRAAVSRGP